MKLFLVLYFCSLFFFTNSISLEIDCQGAILRILDKTTNEKTFFTVPLSQTIELKNSNIVVHKCIKVEREGKNEEIALISHNQFGAIDSETKFFGWIFKSSQYINSPNNPLYDIKLEECLEKDPIFLKNKESI